jgi:hypothetical protein
MGGLRRSSLYDLSPPKPPRGGLSAQRELTMKHRDIEYSVTERVDARWWWTLRPPLVSNVATEIIHGECGTYDEAVAEAKAAIEGGAARAKKSPP